MIFPEYDPVMHLMMGFRHSGGIMFRQGRASDIQYDRSNGSRDELEADKLMGGMENT